MYKRSLQRGVLIPAAALPSILEVCSLVGITDLALSRRAASTCQERDAHRRADERRKPRASERPRVGCSAELCRRQLAVRQEVMKDYSALFELPHVPSNWISKDCAAGEQFEHVLAIVESNSKCEVRCHTHTS